VEGGRCFVFVDSFHFLRITEETTSHLLEKLEICAAAGGNSPGSSRRIIYRGTATQKRGRVVAIHFRDCLLCCNECRPKSMTYLFLEDRAVGDLNWRVGEKK
jgi:hypothetical protein